MILPIAQLADKHSRSLVVTGATGFIGRHVVAELLQQGQSVIALVRPDGRLPARQRLLDALQTTTIDIFAAGRLTVVRADLSKPNFGLSRHERVWLRQRTAGILHLAASTKFNADHNSAPDRTNVHGTRALVEFAQNADRLIPFHHVSTAYVYGTTTEAVRETWLERPGSFRNAYEASKYEAELLVRELSDRGGRVTVHRPSIVVGHSQTGATSSFVGFYWFVRVLARVVELLKKRGNSLRVPADPQTRKNLVPVDYVAKAIATVTLHADLHGRTYHLVNPRPPTLEQIAGAMRRTLSLDGVEWAGPGPLELPSSVEQYFLERIDGYREYLDQEPHFCCDQTVVALAAHGVACPALDDDTLDRLIRYAAHEERQLPPVPRQIENDG